MRIFISILIFISWLGISIKWYVCGIKELCNTEEITTIPEAKEITGNFVFYPKSDTPIVNTQSYKTKDSLIKIINSNEDAKLEIVGLYYTQENIENLGYNRAKNVYSKMFSELNNSKIIFAEEIKEHDTIKNNELFKGVNFNIINSLIVNFESNKFKTTLSETQIQEMKNIIAKVKKGNKTLIIEGHTDNTGTEKFNLKLSEKRANWLKNELLKHGIEKDKIETQAKGLSEPIATNNTEEGKLQNRRTKLIIK